MKKTFLLLFVMLCSIGTYAQGNTPIKGDVNGDGVVDVADINAIIEIMKNGGGTSGATTYYMYIGQTDPSTISSIDNNTLQLTGAGNWYELSGGATGVWFNLGEDIPSTITQSVKGGDADKYWYVMVPVTPGTTLKPVTSDMSTLDTSVSALSTKVYNGVTYQIYWYGGATGARNTFRFAKK